MLSRFAALAMRWAQDVLFGDQSLDASSAVEPAADLGRGQSRTFRKRSNVPRPTPEQMKRQSAVLQSAWRHFGESAPVIAFLNNRHDQLDGWPLHLAVESDEGLRRVERLLEEMTLRAQPPPAGE
jgi:hypothetical protein